MADGQRSILKKPKFGEGFNVGMGEGGLRGLTDVEDLEREAAQRDDASSDDDDDARGGVKFRSIRSLEHVKFMSERHNRIYDDWADVGFFLRYWDIGFSQSDTLTKLRDRLKDVKDPLNRPGIVVRFLVLEKFSVNKAEKRFRDMITWRMQCAALQKGYKPPQELLKHYPGALLKETDKDGDPVFISRLGVTDLAGLTEKFGADELYNYEVFRREFTMVGEWQQEWSKKEGRPFRDIVVIEDMQHLSSKGMSKYIAAIFGAAELDQTFYPEVAKVIVLIRCPKSFRAAWTLGKRSLPKSLRERIEVCGNSDYLKHLEEYVELKDLPPCINPNGGKGELLEGMSPSLDGGAK